MIVMAGYNKHQYVHKGILSVYSPLSTCSNLKRLIMLKTSTFCFQFIDCNLTALDFLNVSVTSEEIERSAKPQCPD